MRHPFRVCQVPLHRFAYARLKRLGRLPAQLALQLAGINGITAVMSRTVGHISDLTGITGAVGLRPQFVQQLANRVHDFDVGLLIPATHVVGLAQPACLQYPTDGAAMVFDIQPIADLHAIAIHRQRFARQRVDDHERDQFFREVVGAVVVGAVGGEHRQAVGVVPGAHQVVAGGLAGAVGAVGFVAMGFGKGRIVLGQRAVDLIGGNMQKAERGLVGLRQSRPIPTHCLEQAEGAHNIGLDELAWAMNGSVDMTFGGKVHHCAWLVFKQQSRNQRSVANVALHKHVAGIALQAGQGFEVSGVSELVEVDNGLALCSKPVEHEIGTDKAGTPCYKNIHFHFKSKQTSLIHFLMEYFCLIFSGTTW